MTNTNNSSPETTQKTKGPVRWGGFVPLLVITALVVAYFMLFFDTHLRWGLEKGLTAANGAKVDIAYLKTRLLHGEVVINRVQVGDPGAPMKNRVEVGSMIFKLRVPPLVKKRVVIEESSIQDVRYGTERKTSAAIPPQPKSDSQFSQKILNGFEKVLKDKVGENEVAQIGGLLSGQNVGDKVVAIGEGSNSFQQLKAAETELDRASKEIETQIKNLPDDGAVQNVKKKIDQVAQSKPKNPEDALKMINELKGIESEVSGMVNKAKSVGDTGSKIAGQVTSSVGAVEGAIDKDVAYVKKQMKVPNLNLKDLTLPLLGPKLGNLLNQAIRYVELARKYMPAKKKGEKEAVVVQERGKGHEFLFGGRADYPTFLLEKAFITSKVSDDPALGDARGELVGVNTNPALYGKPTTATLLANFPKSNVKDAKADIVIDHVTDVAKESGSFTVSSFPVQEWVLMEGSPFFLKVEKAEGQGEMRLNFADDEIKLELNSKLSNVVYATAADNEKLLGILQRALQSFHSLNITARVTGKGDNLDVYMASDLGERLGNSIQQEIKGQLDAANQKIRQQVTEAVEVKKKELLAKVDTFRKNTLGPLEQKVASIGGLKGQIDGQIDRLNKEEDQFLKGKAQEELDKLKGNIKLPF